MASRDHAAVQARREARARAAGFSSYREQRKFRAEAVKADPKLKGNTKAAIARRDAVAKVFRDYQPGSKDKEKLQNSFAGIDDDYFDDDYFDDDRWYDILDELSPDA